MMVGVSPSRIAMHELVVPRSMPRTLLIVCSSSMRVCAVWVFSIEEGVCSKVAQLRRVIVAYSGRSTGNVRYVRRTHGRLSMFCSNCGTKLPDTAMFCPKCGTPVQQEDAPEPGQKPSLASGDKEPFRHRAVERAERCRGAVASFSRHCAVTEPSVLRPQCHRFLPVRAHPWIHKFPM